MDEASTSRIGGNRAVFTALESQGGDYHLQPFTRLVPTHGSELAYQYGPLGLNGGAEDNSIPRSCSLSFPADFLSSIPIPDASLRSSLKIEDDLSKSSYSMIQNSRYATDQPGICVPDESFESVGSFSEDEENDYENDFNQNSYFNRREAAIVRALGPDLELAAYLITKANDWECPADCIRRVKKWQDNVNAYPINDGTGDAVNSTNAGSPHQGSSMSQQNHKRRRSKGSAQDYEEEDDETDDHQNQQKRNGKRVAKEEYLPKLACPFHKMNPTKFGARTGKTYRACAGPGFDTISLLKEHLKRNHYPVQCDRCQKTFPIKANNRSAAIAQLQNHSRLDIPCRKNTRSSLDSMSDAQWARLTEKRGKSQKSTVERWNDIWLILFPDILCPNTPWYSNSPLDTVSQEPVPGRDSYLRILNDILRRDLSGNRGLITWNEDLIARFMGVSRQAFQVWTSLSNEEYLNSSLAQGEQHLSGTPSSWENISGSSTSEPHLNPTPINTTSANGIGNLASFENEGLYQQNSNHGYGLRLDDVLYNADQLPDGTFNPNYTWYRDS